MPRDWSLLIGTDAGLLRAASTPGSTLAIEALGPPSTQVRKALIDRHLAGRLYVGTPKCGVLCSDDAGATWREANNGIRYKDIWSLVQHPTSGTLWAGTEPAAIFRSDDHGETWVDCVSLREMPETAFWTFPRAPHFAHVKDIALVDDNPQLVYAAVEEGWVVRSTDGGQTWLTLKQGVDHDVHAVTVMPDDHRVILVATGVGLYRSDNAGETFARSDDGIPRGFFGGGYLGHVAVHPERPNVLFTCSTDGHPGIWFSRHEGARGVLYRSNDRGRSWHALTNGVPGPLRGAPVATVVDPADPTRVFWGTQDGTIWMTEDGGDTIVKAVEGLPGWLGWLTVHHGSLTRIVDEALADPRERVELDLRALQERQDAIRQQAEAEIESIRERVERDIEVLQGRQEAAQLAYVTDAQRIQDLRPVQDDALTDRGSSEQEAAEQRRVTEDDVYEARRSAEVGKIYDIEVTDEIDNPFIGPNGTSRIGQADVKIPNAKKGETYRVKVAAVTMNQWTGRPEAIVQQQ